MSFEQLEESETTALVKALLDLEKMQVALVREVSDRLEAYHKGQKRK